MSDIPKNLNTPAPELKTSFDILMIKENIKSIQQAINKMELEGKSDPFDFEMAILESHPEFYQSHPFLVKKLCKRDDISFLYQMLGNLEKVESGEKSLAGVELNLGNQLANQYLYPVLAKEKNKK
jgi:hypothetical protein